MDVVVEDLLYFIEAALDGMVGIIEGLGDDLANTKPDLWDANSPFAILTHCLGVMDFWGTQVATGRDVGRDRLAEFRASGTIVELRGRVEAAKGQLRQSLSSVAVDVEAVQPPNRPIGPERDAFAVSTAVVHILEELAQHHGQMEITRDLLNRESAALTDG